MTGRTCPPWIVWGSLMRTVGRKRKTDTHLPKRVYHLHGAFYYYPKPQDRIRIGGKTCKRLGSNLADALAAYGDIIEPKSGTLGEIWEAYKVWMSAIDKRTGKPNNSERTIADKIGYWLVLKGVFANAGPNRVPPKFINQYLRKRERRGAGCQGNKEIALLSHMYTMGMYWELDIDRNPCLGVKRNPTGARDLVVTPDMLSDWIGFASPMLGLTAELMYMTGMRSPDMLKIKLSEISDVSVFVEANKTGKQADYPIDDLKAVFADLRVLAKKPNGTTIITRHLICNRQGRPYTKNGYDSLWQKTAVEYAEAGFIRFAPNDCRSAHADELEDQGGDASKNLQHSNRQITRRHYLRRPQKMVVLGRIKQGK